MPIDVTLKILVQPATLQLTGRKDCMRPRRGDICSVYLASKVSTLQGNGDYLLTGGNRNPVFTYIHVTGIPSAIGDQERLAALRERFMEPISRLNDDQPDANIGLFNSTDIRHRKWRVLFSTFAPPTRSALRNGEERTYTWAAFKTHLKKRVVTDHLDRGLDTESINMTDAEAG